jgi:penicillin-binding protein 1B
MIYTEYFVRGTQPTSVCLLHSSPSFVDRLAGIFGREVGTPVPVNDARLPPPPPTSTSGPSAARPAERVAPSGREEVKEEPQKKRGFWSRVFGLGGDDKKKEEERKREQQRKEEQQRKQEERRKKPGGTPNDDAR